MPLIWVCDAVASVFITTHLKGRQRLVLPKVLTETPPHLQSKKPSLFKGTHRLQCLNKATEMCRLRILCLITKQ